MLCEFCDKHFENLRLLKKHQKYTKKCILLQNKCNGCRIIFKTTQELNEHQISCIPYIIQQTKKECEIECEIKNEKYVNTLKEQIHDLKEELKETKEHVKELQDKLSIASTINITNNNKIDIVIQNLNPVDFSKFEEYKNFLSLSHILDGINGYVRYTIEHPLKDSLVCTDFSRRKIKFKDIEGNVVTDIDMNKLSQPIFKSIIEQNQKIITDHIASMIENEKLSENTHKLSRLLLFVKQASDGDKPELLTKYIREICARTTIE